MHRLKREFTVVENMRQLEKHPHLNAALDDLHIHTHIYIYMIIIYIYLYYYN